MASAIRAGTSTRWRKTRPRFGPLAPCASCAGRTFVRALSLRERAATGGEYGSAYTAPIAATYALDVRETFFAGRPVKSPDHGAPLGTFEAYICRACGYTELFARDAARIPIGREYNTELFELPEDSPADRPR